MARVMPTHHTSVARAVAESAAVGTAKEAVPFFPSHAASSGTCGGSGSGGCIEAVCYATLTVSQTASYSPSHK
jgi:uncharacterized protein (DUF2062 family)